MGKLFFTYGCVNCGKTTELLQAIHNYEDMGKTVFLIKPKEDQKGGSCVISRLGVKKEVDKLCFREDNLLDWFNEIIFKRNIPDAIFVDEVQFLTKDQIYQLFVICHSTDIPVLCYGLRTDYRMNPFPASAYLLSIASRVNEKKTVCRCGKKAIFNEKLVDGVPFFEQSKQIEMESENVSYRPVCANCYIGDLKHSKYSILA